MIKLEIMEKIKEGKWESTIYNVTRFSEDENEYQFSYIDLEDNRSKELWLNKKVCILVNNTIKILKDIPFKKKFSKELIEKAYEFKTLVDKQLEEE